MENKKVEIMTMGSNQVNINGDVVSKTTWEGYSPDGKNININLVKDNNGNEKQTKVRNLDLKDFGNFLKMPLMEENDEFEEIKRKLSHNSDEFKDILTKCKKKKKRKKVRFAKIDKTLNKKKSKPGQTKKKRNKKKSEN